MANAKKIGSLKARLEEAKQKADGQPPHVIVEARAGTGKTTTLIEGLKELFGLGSKLTPSPQQRAVWDAICLSKGKVRTVGFVAFNRSIADELKRRVPAGCEAMTMHGLGCRAVNAAFNRPQVNEYRANDIIADLLGVDGRDLRKKDPGLLRCTTDLVSKAKMNLLGYENGRVNVEAITDEEIDALAYHYDLDFDGVDRAKVYNLVPQVLERCLDVNRDRKMDFDDMVWLPVALGLPTKKFDMLLVDEFQDTNRCQQALAKMAGLRVIAVGDDRQAIYGFAGADAEAMKRFVKEMGETPAGIVKIPLTVTRRCGRAIVAEARKLVPDFEAHEGNGEGSVLSLKFRTEDDKVNEPKANLDYRSSVQNGDMVLCRMNAPLISECFKFIKAGRKANIQGRDIGKGLITLVNKLKATDVKDLIVKLGFWLDNERSKETAKKNPSESRLQGLADRHDCLLVFTEGLTAKDSVDAVTAKIDRIFTDNKDAEGIRLSSIHKAKGLEAQRVFILQPEHAPIVSPKAKGWELEQALNLKYVAITRAVSELVWVS